MAGHGLGDTTDPKKLIPGSPEAVEADAEALSNQSTAMSDIGEALKRVDVGSWFGAASHAFEDSFSEQPLKWLKASVAVAAASGALIRYAHTLRWAQGQASEAIGLWEEGEEATARARSAHDSAVANASADTGIPSLSDPGKEQRAQAEYLLKEARAQLADMADETMTAIVGPVAGAAVGGQLTLAAGQDALSSLTDTVTHGWRSNGTADANGPDLGWHLGGGFGQLFTAKAYADLFHATAKGSVTRGPVKLSGIADYYVGARAIGNASWTDEEASVKVAASYGERAMAEGRAEAGPLGYYERVSGFRGAEVGFNAGVGREGFNATGDAFVGAKGEIAEGVEAGGLGTGVTAEGWVGVGAEADLTVGKYKEGKYHVRGELGGAAFIGGSIGYEFTVDPGKVADTASDAADAVSKGAGTVKNAAGSAKSAITDYF